MTMARREKAASNQASTSVVPGGGDWSKWWPNVVEFLCRSRWEDGASRETGTLMIFCEGGAWKAWLHDRDLEEGAFLSAQTPEELLQLCDEGIGSGKLDWRPDKSRRAGKTR
jgi:hypothetical protein